MNEQIKNILDENLKNKEILDLIITTVDTSQCLASESKDIAMFTLIEQGRLSSILENLVSVSKSINNVDSKLSDLLEDAKNENSN